VQAHIQATCRYKAIQFSYTSGISLYITIGTILVATLATATATVATLATAATLATTATATASIWIRLVSMMTA